jgi:site-specific DNA-cytosine methylase
MYPEFATAAKNEVWETTLDPNRSDEVIQRIEEALGDKKNGHWVLVGGPPCQAFSLAGRSRMRYTDGIPNSDLRPSLYKIYLDILRELKPTIFLMENVESLISARLESEDNTAADRASPEKETATVFVMPRILEDFCDHDYVLHSVSHNETKNDIRPYSKKHNPPPRENGQSPSHQHDKFRQFVVKSEHHGIPQQRHRVIIMGINDHSLKDAAPKRLSRQKKRHTRYALKKLPGRISKITGLSGLASDEWGKMIEGFHGEWWMDSSHFHLQGEQVEVYERLKSETISKLKELNVPSNENNVLPKDCSKDQWKHPLDHEPRRHKKDDLRRYLFASYFACLHDGDSPHLRDFPHVLLPRWKKFRIDSSSDTTCELIDPKGQVYRITWQAPSKTGWTESTSETARLYLTEKTDHGGGFPGCKEGSGDGLPVKSVKRFDKHLAVDVQIDEEIDLSAPPEFTLIDPNNLKNFSDAFVVQPPDKPAFTITCHAGKDGHKSIHHEPWQCRSLTVREVARIQTFPDNYLFFGNATQKFTQVGNAVPPELAKQLAKVVFDVLKT